MIKLKSKKISFTNHRAMVIFLGIILIVFVFGFSLMPTSATQKNVDVSGIGWGMTPSALEDLMGDSGQFQFHVLYEDEIYECVTYPFVSEYNSYYFVFREKSLVSINWAYDFHKTEVVPYRGSKREIEASWVTAEKLEAIITTPSLSRDEFLNQLKVKTIQLDSRKESLFDSNIWPIAIAFRILGPFTGNSQESWRTSDAFSPKKIQLGMSEEEVINLFGKPRFSTGDGEKKTLSFGPEESFWSQTEEEVQLQGNVEEYWVSVSFKEDKVVGIFSDDLFNREKIVTLSNYLK